MNLESKFKIIRPNNTSELSIKQDGDSTFEMKVDVPEVLSFKCINIIILEILEC